MAFLIALTKPGGIIGTSETRTDLPSTHNKMLSSMAFPLRSTRHQILPFNELPNAQSLRLLPRQLRLLALDAEAYAHAAPIQRP
mmetsp:Transcript_12932/g.20464  ORF Transcript_12932/g.20464 Transcript_12932/m.20464 type:complete len:84 (+) Transcript_12932:445-696(+)